MVSSSDSAHTLIVLSPEHESFYEFLKDRPNAEGQVQVILDRRQSERRQQNGDGLADRRQRQRRVATPQAALALKSVLGFMVLHRAGEGWIA